MTSLHPNSQDLSDNLALALGTTGAEVTVSISIIGGSASFSPLLSPRLRPRVSALAKPSDADLTRLNYPSG